MGKSVAFYTLGCKVNHYETQAMRELFMQAGYEIKDFEDSADIYVINTCTVTNIADRKSRQMLHRAKKRNPDAVVAAVGCYAQGDADQLALDDAVDLVVGNDRKGEIVRLVENEIENRQGAADEELLDINAVRTYEPLQISGTADQTRVYIKIQDGCNQFCSYCRIPYVRGRVRSRSEEDIVEEVQRFAGMGFQEAVLTGIHISSYGMQTPDAGAAPGQHDYRPDGSRLIDLIEAVDRVSGIRRIRLGSLEPRIITEDFLQRLSAVKSICPHFHLSLQSGCDSVLRRMNRKYTTALFAEKCALIRKYFHAPAITTDVIVGFPGETEEEFAQTVRFLSGIQFESMHIFRYSRRDGTKAAAMPGQVDPQIMAQRSDVLLELSASMHEDFVERHKDDVLEVLLEEKIEEDGIAYMCGHSRNYLKCLFPAEGLAPNQIVCGRIQGMRGDAVLCALTEEKPQLP